MSKRSEFRFGVGCPVGNRSYSWKVWWIGDGVGDVYLKVREETDDFKVSIHKDGNAFVGKSTKAWIRDRNRPGLDSDSRMRAKWKSVFRTPDDIEALYHVVVASSDLQESIRFDKNTDQVTWISDPGEGMQTEFFLFRGPRGERAGFPTHVSYPSEEVGHLDRGDLRLWIVKYVRPETDFHNAAVLRQAINRRRTQAGVDIENIADDWIMMVGFTSDEGLPGERMLCGNTLRQMLVLRGCDAT